MNRLLLTLFFCFLFAFPVFPQGLEFYSEDITFEIKNNYFYVNGIYHFCNVSEKEIKKLLFFPFPIDSIYGEVDSFKVTDLNRDLVNNIVKKNEKGAYFTIKLEPYGITKYRIFYRQKLLENKAEYILTTTQRWGKAFEQANYQLIVSDKTRIDSRSYQPDSCITKYNKKVYFWHREDFMPDRNMIILFDSKM